LTLTASTLSTGTNFNLTVGGNWTNNGGTLSGGTSTVTLGGAGKTISGSSSTTFHSLTVRSSGTYTMSNSNSCTTLLVSAQSGAQQNSASLTFSGTPTLTVSGNATVTKFDDLSGTWNINAGTATISGNLTLSASGSNSGGVAKAVLTTGTLTVSGNLVHTNSQAVGVTLLSMSGAATVNLAGAYTVNTLGTQTPGTTSIFNYNGSASAQTVSFASAITYANLYLNNTNASGATLGAAITTSNVVTNLRVQSGTLSNGGFAVDGGAADVFEVVNGATYKMTTTTGMVTGFGTKTLGASSTCDYAGTTQTVSNESYGNLSLSGSNTKTMPGTSMTVAGNFSMSGTASATAAAAIAVSGNLTIGSTAVFDAASYSHSIGGNFTNNNTFTASTSTVTLNGSSSQAIAGTTATSFNHLTINNSSGVTLSVNPTINGVLTFTSGNITTSSNKVIVSSTGSVSRTSGHVVGNLQKNVGTGSGVARTYEVGDAGAYAPVNVTFASVSVSGNLTVSTTSGDHPNIGTSDIDPTKTANRYWTLAVSGLTYTTYGATFNFVSGDLDAGANTTTFSVRRYSGGSWSNMSIGTNTSTSAEITGASAVGDFQCGNVPSLSVSASNTVFAFGSQPPNTWLTPQSSVLTNDGSVTENIAVQISTFTTGSNTWTLSASSNGADQIRAQWSITSSGGPWTDIAAYATNFTVVSSLAASGTL
ncbi:MAG: beta strand repeat-containing protein, partial [Gaiellaceae bacterium]